MLISAQYVCPIRGLAGLEPPEPERLGKAATVAKNLGLDRLILPVLEEALLGSPRAKVAYLDGLIHCLDQIEDAGLKACLIAPARRVLGLDWVPPYLVKALRDNRAEQVFLEGRVRNLWPYNWWVDPAILQKRVHTFQELAAAVAGHPALTGWVVMDRELEWVRSDLHVADVMLKSCLAELREKNENMNISLGLGWLEFLYPETANTLAKQVDGLRIAGLENPPSDFNMTGDLSSEHKMAAYLGILSQWLFDRPAEVEIGWSIRHEKLRSEEIAEAGRILPEQGLAEACWLSLVDPEPNLHAFPPWLIQPRLGRVGLLDRGLEPKAWVEPWFRQIRDADKSDHALDFIDISAKDYLEDPETHFTRLWDHFLEGAG